MFEKFYQNVMNYVISIENYKPIPTIDERDSWDKLPEELSKELIAEGEKYLGYNWPAILATDFMDYRRTGSRALLHTKTWPRRNALLYLVLSECIENKGRFIDDIVNGIWATCDEATWVISAHNPLYPISGETAPVLPDTAETVKIFIDIMGSDVGALMAITYHLIGKRMDTVTPSINRRLLKTLNERILTPYLINDDYPWMGAGRGSRFINNWTTWVISNVLVVASLVMPGVETRAKVIEKSLYYLDKFIKNCPNDGSYTEGAGYWTVACGALLNSLVIIKEMTGGRLDFISDEKVQKLTSFIYRVHIDGNMFANYADTDLYLEATAQRLYSIGLESGNKTLQQFAIAMRDWNGSEIMADRLMRPYPAIKELFEYASFKDASSVEFPYQKNSWYDVMQIMCEREAEGTSKGLYLSVKGGTNLGPHNHMDVGSFLIFSDGKPAIIDIGTGEYNAATFGINRHKVPQISSEWHNVPFICGCAQHLDMKNMSFSDAEVYCAKDVKYVTDGELTELSMNIRDVYSKECTVDYWRRIFQFNRSNKKISIIEDFKLTKSEADTYISLVTASRPVVENGLIVIHVNGGKDIVIRYPNELMPKIDEYYVGDDERLAKVWGERVWRLRLFLSENTLEDKIILDFQQKNKGIGD